MLVGWPRADHVEFRLHVPATPEMANGGPLPGAGVLQAPRMTGSPGWVSCAQTDVHACVRACTSIWFGPCLVASPGACRASDRMQDLRSQGYHPAIASVVAEVLALLPSACEGLYVG